jgi:DNA (cytosine-5)-methyltransferase 1
MKLAAQSVGMRVDVVLAADADKAALQIYKWNHGPQLPIAGDISTLVNYHVAGSGEAATWSTRPSIIDPQARALTHELDILVAGPPCQGHSNLNNRTRRSDLRNLLYLPTIAFVVASQAKICIIENVPDIVNDSHDVLRTARALLIKSGYRFDDAVLSADDFGVPQRRKRHFLVAVRDSDIEFELQKLVSGLKVGPISVREAIGDLLERPPESQLDVVGELSKENKRRIDWLFDHNEYVLPDRHRPTCHQEGHSYPSVYGRMHWDEPAQTITTGYLSPGRGRYVHPGARRTITPHEAARLQSFPDSYSFLVPDLVPSRALLQKVIGDAVPPLLGRAVGIAALALIS